MLFGILQLMTKTQTPRTNLSKIITNVDMLGGITLFCVGVAKSSTQFLGGIAALVFCTPGLFIFALALISLRPSISPRISRVLQTSCTTLLVAVCIAVLVGWYTDFSASRFYVNLYNNTKMGMSYEEVLQLAGGRSGKCKPYLFNKNYTDCVWINSVYSPSGILISSGNNYVEIVFNSNGFAISKNAPGH
jgi:hypothetical protein